MAGQYNCDPLAEDKTGVTPIQLAAGKGSMAILKYFVEERGADANHLDHCGRSPLHAASQEGEFEAAEYLVLSCHADPMKRDTKHKVTSLHLAANNGYTKLVKLFCSQRNALVDCRDGYNLSLIHI